MKKNVVVKFGGTSVTGIANILCCINKVIELQKENNVIVVVSAEAGTTDRLERMIDDCRANKVCIICEDLIKSTGEMISIGLFTGALKSMGVNAHPLCGWQVPIITKDRDIIDIHVDKIMNLINQNIIPVIAGFQGVDIDGNITTLARGGSDITAAALAKYMNLEECYIYTDVEAVYRINPVLIENSEQNRKIAQISYKDMYSLARNGAKIIHPDAVQIAAESNIKLYVGSSFSDNLVGTLITNTEILEYGISLNSENQLYVLHNGHLPKNLDKDEIIICNDREMYIYFNQNIKLKELCNFVCQI